MYYALEYQHVKFTRRAKMLRLCTWNARVHTFTTQSERTAWVSKGELGMTQGGYTVRDRASTTATLARALLHRQGASV